MMSVVGSPNNLGLFMGRVLPIVAAIALMSRHRPRRLLYALTFPFMLGAAVLSFSKGALILGVPLSLAVVILFWGGRRAVIGLAGLAAAGVVAAIPLSQSPRFADTFNFTSGTSFFRIQLWRSVISMIADHPWLGVGLDNFLYAYRGKYILPEAWQEPNLAHAHNIILDSLARLGVFGFATTLWMLNAFFLSAYTTLNRLTDPDLRALTIGLIASMINCLAHGMVDTGYWFVDLAFVFMMTSGITKKLESGDWYNLGIGSRRFREDAPDETCAN
jgi:O-antigen ligase